MKHGHKTRLRATTTYLSWINMRQRCLNNNHPNYKYYGGRGIKICDRWLESYINFLRDMGEKPSKEHTIDRINNDGSYELSNCQWITKSENVSKRNFKHGKSYTKEYHASKQLQYYHEKKSKIL